MKMNALTAATLLALALTASCRNTSGPNGPTDVSAWKGVVINEIAAHDEIPDADSWVELFNSSASTIDLTGLGLYLTDSYFNGKKVYEAPAGEKLAAGERLLISTADESLVTGIASDAQFVLKLAVEDGTAVDTFDRDAVFASGSAVNTAAGSYQRLPDGASSWRNLTYASPGRENKLFELAATRPNAFWAWSSHVSSLSANNFANLKNLKSLGYDHIILNYLAFEYSNKPVTKAFIAAAEEIGVTVHAWLQCFYSSGAWVNPVDDANNRYKDEIFAGILSRARTYIEDFGVKGIHLDYIRYPGTAYKHNPSAEVTAVGAVTRCCREIRELTDSYDEGLVTSGALMPENGGAYYYGQDYNQMGKYLHILMPMLYRHGSYHYNDDTCRKFANMFGGNTGGAACWAGTTTYSGNDSSVTPMDAESILKDCKVYVGTKATGIVLFRYGLGTFPDVNDLWP
jgi:hypothetical protein